MRDIGVTGVQTCALPIYSVLVMVGDGPDRVVAQEEARQLGVADGVFFLGKIDAVAPLLACAHLFLLPSNSRSEERRVGKECRSRWSPYHYKKNPNSRPSL